LSEKSTVEVAAALGRIYKHDPLTWPRLLHVDPGHEFMGAVNQLRAKHGVSARRGCVDTHHDQGIVERFNRTIAERLFGYQYAQKLLLATRGSSKWSAEWVARLPAVVTALNNEVTRLTGKKPKDAIMVKTVTQKPSSVVPGRPIGLEEPLVPSPALVRYLYQPGGRRRATDPVWSLTTRTIRGVVRQVGQRALYYLFEGLPAVSFASNR